MDGGEKGELFFTRMENSGDLSLLNPYWKWQVSHGCSSKVRNCLSDSHRAHSKAHSSRLMYTAYLPILEIDFPPWFYVRYVFVTLNKGSNVGY